MKAKSVPNFTLDEEYITSITETKPVKLHLDTGEVMEGTSVGSIDHPKFTELRDKLEADGFITTWREVCNGDRVLKPFKLNSLSFEPGDKFFCASAMDVQLRIKQSNNEASKKPKLQRKSRKTTRRG